MSTLKTPLKFLDTIMNKVSKKEFYLVLHETVHNVWVVDTEGKEEPKEIPKRMLNMAYIKVDPKSIKVLFGDKDEKNTVVIDGVDPSVDSAEQSS